MTEVAGCYDLSIHDVQHQCCFLMAFKRSKIWDTFPKAAVPLIAKYSSNILLLYLIHGRVAKDMGSTLGLPNLDQIAARLARLVASGDAKDRKDTLTYAMHPSIAFCVAGSP